MSTEPPTAEQRLTVCAYLVTHLQGAEPAAWGVVLTCRGRTLELSGVARSQRREEAIAHAALATLQALKAPAEVAFLTCHDTVRRVLTQWRTHEANGWLSQRRQSLYVPDWQTWQAFAQLAAASPCRVLHGDPSRLRASRLAHFRRAQALAKEAWRQGEAITPRRRGTGDRAPSLPAHLERRLVGLQVRSGRLGPGRVVAVSNGAATIEYDNQERHEVPVRAVVKGLKLSLRQRGVRKRDVSMPHALNEAGERIAPEAAGQAERLSCPSCGEPVTRVTLKAGAATLVHADYERDCRFTANVVVEGRPHRRSKKGLVARINAGEPITVIRRCRGCGHGREQSLTQAGRALRAREEVLLAHGFSADVGLFGEDGRLLAIIEVVHAHTVSEQKRRAYNRVPWIEVSARKTLKALEQSPCVLDPVQDHFDTFTCRSCRQVNKRRVSVDGRWVEQVVESAAYGRVPESSVNRDSPSN